jgi:hypothetical protein
MRIWNPFDFQGQGHRVKFLGEEIRHALQERIKQLYYYAGATAVF